MLGELTESQESVFKVMINFKSTNDSLPTGSEIKRIFGWTSPNSAPQALRMLTKKGWIEGTETSIGYKLTAECKLWIMKKKMLGTDLNLKDANKTKQKA